MFNRHLFGQIKASMRQGLFQPLKVYRSLPVIRIEESLHFGMTFMISNFLNFKYFFIITDVIPIFPHSLFLEFRQVLV